MGTEEAQQRREWYYAWNQAIVDHVFTASQAHRPVYLQVDDELVEALATEIGCAGEPADELRNAVRGTLRPIGPIFAAHVNALRRWRAESLPQTEPPPPPCIALLALFVRSAGNMGSGDGIAQNNYYERLLDELKLTAKTDLQHEFRAHSLHFWDSLRLWLEAWGGQRGLYTVQQIGGFKFIGRPISQALVRLHDRRRLKSFFVERQYSRDHPPEPNRMERDLDRWLHKTGSPASSTLREQWDRGTNERRAAIIQIVLNELRAWDGSTFSDQSETSASRGSRVSLAIQFLKKGFVESPELLFLVPGPKVSAPHQRYSLKPQGQSDQTQSWENYWIEKLPQSHWYSLEPASDLASEVGLVSELDLYQPDLQLRLHRHASELIPLKRDEANRLFVECGHVMDPSGEYAVLCTDSLADSVEALLSHLTDEPVNQAAGPTGDIPAGWTLFRDIRFARTEVPPDLRQPDLIAIIPRPRYFFRIEGGLRLPTQRTWHTDWPPDIGNVPEQENESLLVTVTPLRQNQDAEELQFEERRNIKLGDCSPPLPDGDYTIRLYRRVPDGDWEPADSAVSHLRSSSWPFDAPGRYALGRPLGAGNTLSYVTAVDLTDAAHPGAAICGACRLEPASKADLQHPALAGPVLQSALRTSDRPSIAEEFGLKLTGDDLLLDALSCVLAGPWPAFAQMAGRCDPSGAPPVAAQRLSSLGHVEVQLSRHDMRPQAWCIAPPALVREAFGEDAFLVGFRSPDLVAIVAEVVREIDGRIQADHPHSPGPARLRITGLGSEDLALVASEVSDRAGISIQLSDKLPEQLLAGVPPLPELAATLPEVPMPLEGKIDRFSTMQRRWSKALEPFDARAYRVDERGRIYGIATDAHFKNGRLGAAGKTLAENLAFVLEGRSLTEYHENTGRLVASSGRAFPEPLERAAVLCSGVLPRYQSRERSYFNVPVGIAERLRTLTSPSF